MTTPANTSSQHGVRGYNDQDGNWYVGVTGLIRATLADAPQLARWKQKRLIGNALDVRSELESRIIDRDYIVHEALRRQYESGPEAQLGTAVHKAIEDYENGVELTITDKKVLGHLDQWLHLKAEHNLEVLTTEITLVNTQLKYAGTADSIIQTSLAPYRDDRFVLDVKTGKGVYDTYALQLALLARCDSWLAADGTIKPLKKTLNTQYGIVAKLGQRSAHLHRVNLYAAWKVAGSLPKIFTWLTGGGTTTISGSLPGNTQRALAGQADKRRATILKRARALDTPTKQAIEQAWQADWPSLKYPNDFWTDDNLDEVETLIANAERGAVA